MKNPFKSNKTDEDKGGLIMLHDKNIEPIEVPDGMKMKTYSKDDLIRKPSARQIILSISIIMLIVGTRSWDYSHDYKGMLCVGMGLLFLGMLWIAYENLLEEKRSYK